MIRARLGGIGVRVALAAVSSVAVAVAIIALGVTVLGGDAFTRIMTSHGQEPTEARAMFDESVTRVVIVAMLVAALVAGLMAIAFARRLTKPLRDIGAAARRVAEGDYRARVPREGAEELASLADSFNQMAASLEEQRRVRRDFIANAAHELRTPLTNLKGYLEALRDGVVPAERATYDSLLEEAERLVRLSRSLDALAEGDAASDGAPLADLDLGAAIRSAVELAGPAFSRADLALTLDVPDRLRARANADHLAQVLANLLQNALRYTPSGGRVTVPGVAPCLRRPGRDREHRRGNSGVGPAPRLRALLPRRQVARPGERRSRHRARHRAAARRGGGWTRRRRVKGRVDALLVQPAATRSGGDLRTEEA